MNKFLIILGLGFVALTSALPAQAAITTPQHCVCVHAEGCPCEGYDTINVNGDEINNGYKPGPDPDKIIPPYYPKLAGHLMNCGNKKDCGFSGYS